MSKVYGYSQMTEAFRNTSRILHADRATNPPPLAHELKLKPPHEGGVRARARKVGCDVPPRHDHPLRSTLETFDRFMACMLTQLLT